MQKISQNSSRPIIGRYAPSPTGDLHLGNLRTALIAWLHARGNSGRFLVRMEDVDAPRVVSGSDKKILDDLEWLGLDWDGEVVYQSNRLTLYRDALNDLSAKRLTYPCFCSRKDIRQAGSAPHAKPGAYPGTCSNLCPEQVRQRAATKHAATRLRVSADLQKDCGDFVLHRTDGLFAYQLAVVVDDLEQSVTDVVRGEDLADSTPRQLFLARLLAGDGSAIGYHHVPLMNDNDGQRMSKRDGSFSASQWRAMGGTSESLLAKLASSVGLIDKVESISASELLLRVNGSALDGLTKRT